jgi:hypothetical protein
MARIKGTPKTGGRKRGTKNKRTTERERAQAEIAVRITERSTQTHSMATRMLS